MKVTSVFNKTRMRYKWILPFNNFIDLSLYEYIAMNLDHPFKRYSWLAEHIQIRLWRIFNVE